MGGIRSAISVFTGERSRARVADRAAAELRERLPADCTVLGRYEPRDEGAEFVSLVVVGPHGVLVVEPCDDEGALVCYQDHWYRRTAPGVSQPLSDSPSRRARHDATRVKSDLASGGFIYTAVEAVVVLTRGRDDDCGSSCVPVVVGIDALTRQIVSAARPDASAERTRALVAALASPIRLTPV